MAPKILRKNKMVNILENVFKGRIYKISKAVIVLEVMQMGFIKRNLRIFERIDTVVDCRQTSKPLETLKHIKNFYPVYHYSRHPCWQ